MITIKTAHEIELMAEGGRRLALVLRELKKLVKPGITTLELDRKAEELIRAKGDRPAFKGYRPHGAREAYPYTLCASVNEGVVHGRPSEMPLADGDVLKLDMGLVHSGFYVDSAVTVAVGAVSDEAQRLMRATEEALAAGIKAARAGAHVGAIGAAVERIIERAQFSIVTALTGHGIGRELHEDPSVFNIGPADRGEELVPGMVLAIEPMVAVRSGRVRQLKDDSFATADGSLAAHFEHTVAITEQGPRILTKA